MDEETIGQRIKRLREARGFTLPSLAKHLVTLGAPSSLTKAAIHKWETGDTKNMQNATFVLLAQALGTDTAYLLWGQNRSPLPPKALASMSRNAKG